MDSMNPKYLRIDLDQAYTVALKYPAPVIVNGFAGKECRWMLANGQAMYTPLDLRQQIEAFKPGQPFTIQKVRAGPLHRMENTERERRRVQTDARPPRGQCDRPTVAEEHTYTPQRAIFSDDRDQTYYTCEWCGAEVTPGELAPRKPAQSAFDEDELENYRRTA